MKILLEPSHFAMCKLLWRQIFLLAHIRNGERRVIEKRRRHIKKGKEKERKKERKKERNKEKKGGKKGGKNWTKTEERKKGMDK